MPTLKMPLIVTADCAIATAGAARTPATASARSFFCIKECSPLLFVYGGAYAPPPKPLVLPGFGHSPQSEVSDATKTRFAKAYNVILLHLRNKSNDRA